jgi:2-polyprenyl-3-methyl-5-hydroxy-6-metoxy-1,4-benzoquinol methylase
MQTDCPICEKQRTLVKTQYQCTDYISQQTFALNQCEACGCYVTEIEQQSRQVDYYGKTYYNSARGKFSPLIEKIFRFSHKRNALMFYKQFHPDTVLEIGCGRGYLLRELKALGCQVHCLESNQAAEWILNNSEVAISSISDNNINNWPFSSDFFQLVIFWHVLEHLPDPSNALKEAARLLKKDGVVCISVPNVASYQARLKLSTWFHLDVPRHLFHFSQASLVELLEKQGYQIIKMTSGDATQNLFGWFQSLANLATPRTINSFYRFLQGGILLKTAGKLSLLIQLATSVLWLPIGLAGYFLEELTGHHGTVTIYARKMSTEAEQVVNTTK